ncbi:TetR/AcrR family transcriptional regulator [Actinokineospora bangkokensis]|uniref:TetR family transcriptional regulator n=1 Tax=Actinokineospora bangkokensis TaxID=1193682 RepID=A0A1Q9LK92_9PSEU|nr:helix-turn-helix domain-containing protein [Actinokineospora bangkokensis]OLR92414.1 TetR family transcriptional regulator [Actinokineospora bangkokensis]
MTGLREQKKQATRVALREAALRLAVERGPENVRVDDIAAAAGVSVRTYNNYYASREQAIVAAITAEREGRVAAALAARADEPLAEAVVAAVVEQYTDPGADTRPLIEGNPALRAAFTDTTPVEDPLAEAIGHRVGDPDTAAVLAAATAAAVRVALRRWTAPGPTGLVVVSGPLPDLLRRALSPLAPALAAAEAQSGK